MWLVLLAAAISAIAWVADLKASHIPVREELPAPVDLANRAMDHRTGGIGRLLDR